MGNVPTSATSACASSYSCPRSYAGEWRELTPTDVAWGLDNNIIDRLHVLSGVFLSHGTIPYTEPPLSYQYCCFLLSDFRFLLLPCTCGTPQADRHHDACLGYVELLRLGSGSKCFREKCATIAGYNPRQARPLALDPIVAARMPIAVYIAGMSASSEVPQSYLTPTSVTTTTTVPPSVPKTATPPADIFVASHAGHQCSTTAVPHADTAHLDTPRKRPSLSTQRDEIPNCEHALRPHSKPRRRAHTCLDTATCAGDTTLTTITTATAASAGVAPINTFSITDATPSVPTNTTDCACASLYFSSCSFFLSSSRVSSLPLLSSFSLSSSSSASPSSAIPSLCDAAQSPHEPASICFSTSTPAPDSQLSRARISTPTLTPALATTLAYPHTTSPHLFAFRSTTLSRSGWLCRGEVLGDGGCGIVFRCYRAHDGHVCALKRITLTVARQQQDVWPEVAILLRLHGHENIIRIHDCFCDGAHAYIVTEYCMGGSLYDLIAARGPVAEMEAAWLCQQLGKALQHMHTHGVVHHDLKPENILLMGDRHLTLKVADFGLSTMCGLGIPDSTSTSTLMPVLASASVPAALQQGPSLSARGTWAYCAPEMLCASAYDARVDMWSLGVCMFVMLGGYHPFDADTDSDADVEFNTGTTACEDVDVEVSADTAVEAARDSDVDHDTQPGRCTYGGISASAGKSGDAAADVGIGGNADAGRGSPTGRDVGVNKKNARVGNSDEHVYRASPQSPHMQRGERVPRVERVRHAIMCAAYDFQDAVWGRMSQEARDIIAQLLVADPRQRMSLEEFLSMPWIMQARRPQEDAE